MKVLANRFAGLLQICSTCGAVLAYNKKDVYGEVIYCPLCKKPTRVPLIDGEINKELTENDIDKK